MNRPKLVAATLVLLTAAACGGGGTAATTSSTTPVPSATTAAAPTSAATVTEATASSIATETTTVTSTTPASTPPDESPASASSTFRAEVWADNWFAMSVNGTPIGEDSVPITTERSFNSETFTFEAAYPLTIAIEAKDFKENDSGLEYMGAPNQQMGDGGLIAQITDVGTGMIVAVTDGTWATLVIHRAPLNRECESNTEPLATCQSEISAAPDAWTAVSFDDAGWISATVWSEADVRPKDGYDQISWDPSAQLIWGTDLEIDNTVLFRTVVGN